MKIRMREKARNVALFIESFPRAPHKALGRCFFIATTQNFGTPLWPTYPLS